MAVMIQNHNLAKHITSAIRPHEHENSCKTPDNGALTSDSALTHERQQINRFEAECAVQLACR